MIFLSIPYIHYKLMKLNFAIYLVMSLSSWWKQPLGKSYGIQWQNGVMVQVSFGFRKTKNCRQHALTAEVVVGDLRAFATEWQGTNRA